MTTHAQPKFMHKTPPGNTQVLVNMLHTQRPHQSKTEEEFLLDLMKKIPGSTQDKFGNIWYTIGAEPTTLFASHVDTVHKTDGRQNVNISSDGTVASLPSWSPSNCLGADDTTGVWLMLQMIEAKVPGTYIFHRGEEKHGLGSAFIADHHPERLECFERCVSFDRKGTTSVITHQMSRRCCSDEFGVALMAALGKTGLTYKLDTGGSFTDSANYMEIIPECTNISVGYTKQHTKSETQDLAFADRLAKALVRIDWERLPSARRPGPPTVQTLYPRSYDPYAAYDPYYDDLNFEDEDAPEDTPADDTPDFLLSHADCEMLAFDEPELAAEVLYHMQACYADVEAVVHRVGRTDLDRDLATYLNDLRGVA